MNKKAKKFLLVGVIAIVGVATIAISGMKQCRNSLASR